MQSVRDFVFGGSSSSGEDVESGIGRLEEKVEEAVGRVESLEVVVADAVGKWADSKDEIKKDVERIGSRFENVVQYLEKGRNDKDDLLGELKRLQRRMD